MTTYQDSSDPTGVAADGSNAKRPRGEVVKIRNRKADAALQMRLSGATWSEIAEVVGYPTPRQALTAVEKALQRQLVEDQDKDKMRRLAGQRLDRLLRSIWNKAVDPNSPEQATMVSKARELIADHTKLYGLAAPAEITVHTPTQNDLEEWVMRITAGMVPEAKEADIWEGDVVDAEVIDDQPEALGA